MGSTGAALATHLHRAVKVVKDPAFIGHLEAILLRRTPALAKKLPLHAVDSLAQLVAELGPCGHVRVQLPQIAEERVAAGP